MRRLLPGLTAALVAAAAFSTVAPAQAREVVAFRGDYSPGTIVIRTGERRLYLVKGGGQALRYPVAVGMAGRQWSGATMIQGMRLSPAWSPPAEVKRAKPSLPNVIPGGAPGNPMGAAALLLHGEYAIHGTSASMRASIGSAASFGCIRMLNEHVLDLYSQVHVGTPVVVTR